LLIDISEPRFNDSKVVVGRSFPMEFNFTNIEAEWRKYIDLNLEKIIVVKRTGTNKHLTNFLIPRSKMQFKRIGETFIFY
jgi:hypothetical protein